MQKSSWLKATTAVLVAAALLWIGYRYFETSRHFVLFAYSVALFVFSYFVVILRGRGRDLALVGATLVLGLGFIEIAVSRVGGLATTYKENGSWGRKADLGWSPLRPGVFREKKVAANGDVIYDVTDTIDEHLNRKVDSAASGPTVAFFGDSFTFGAGLNDAETLPQVFADLTNRKFRVLNLAVTAYGPQQFQRALETNAHDALLNGQNPRLFVMLTFPFHAARASCKDPNSWFAPSYALVNGDPVYRGACADQASGVSGALRALLRGTEMFQYLVESRVAPVDAADIDLYIAILTKAGRLAREKYNVPTLILYLPEDFSDPRYRLGSGVTNADIMRRLREGGLDVAEINFDSAHYPLDSLVIKGDGHPTALTDRLWAQRLADIVMTQYDAGQWR